MSKQVPRRESALVGKIRSLPPEKVAEVEDFVEFLSQREDRQLTQAAAKLAEKAFRKAWDNSADAATTGYNFGDVVLVPFPFTDQSGLKKRPAVVVSSAEYHGQRRDLVIMAVTT